MDLIVWTEELSVGITRMDEQHKRLIAMINRLAVEPDTTTESVLISDLLTDMIRYAREHFRDEEAMLIAHEYPFISQQKEQHLAFIQKTVDFCSAVEVGVGMVPQALLTYLKEWLVHHILEQDMKYRTFFQDLDAS